MSVCPRALACLLIIGLTGCSHTTRVRSDPAGAEVYILPDDDSGDDEEGAEPQPAMFVGHTPCEVETGFGSPFDTRRYVVVHDDEAVAFTLRNGQITWDSFVASAISAGTGFVLCGGVSAATATGGILTLPLPWFSVPLFCTSACCGVAALAQPVTMVLNMWAPADDVFVHVDGGNAVTTPEGLVEEVGPTEAPDSAVPREKPPSENPGNLIEVKAIAY